MGMFKRRGCDGILLTHVGAGRVGPSAPTHPCARDPPEKNGGGCQRARPLRPTGCARAPARALHPPSPAPVLGDTGVARIGNKPWARAVGYLWLGWRGRGAGLSCPPWPRPARVRGDARVVAPPPRRGTTLPRVSPAPGPRLRPFCPQPAGCVPAARACHSAAPLLVPAPRTILVHDGGGVPKN
eukprot:gene25907-biopygen19531